MELKKKICPKCNKNKNIKDFYSYFSKQRQKYRISNYCKICGRKDSIPRAKIHYENNKPEKLQYAKNYRKQNAEKIKKERPKYKHKQIEELQDCYVRELIVSNKNNDSEFVDSNPEIIENRRLQIKIKRKIKSLKNGKK